MMKDKNIVLIGFMGVGKSVASRILDQRLKKEVVSTDAWIEKKEGMPIKDIFKQKGEKAFRLMEEEAVQKIASLSGVIIDCGGGIPINPLNIKRLKETGVVIYLKAKSETILKNIGNEMHRPLLNTANPRAKIEELLKEREKFYKQADHIVDANNCTGEVLADRIMEIINNE